jgi:hypothetical protein
MRTTLEIPDDLFKQAKMRAVQEGVALKEVVTRALVRELTPGSRSLARRKARAGRLFKELDKARNVGPVGRLNREEIYDRPELRGH